MAYSIQREVSDGTLQTLTLRITYFKKTHISVYVDDKLADGSAGRYSWVWDGDRIRLNAVVPTGVEVLIRRKTPMDTPFHTFRQGAVFKDVTMDENFIQQLYINQENVEGLSATDFYSDLDLHNYRLKNVGTAITDTDVVTLGQYRADALGANQYRILAENSKVAAKAAEVASAASAAAALVSENKSKASETAAKASEDSTTASKNAAKASETNAKASETAAKASEVKADARATVSTQQADFATSQAVKAKAEADRAGSIVGFEPVPLPDVWIPFTEGLDMLAGTNFAKKKVKFGEDTVLFPDDKTVSFSRAGTATYIDKSGVLRTAAVDEPRFEKEGLLIEGQSTNLIPYSSTRASFRGEESGIILTNMSEDDGAFFRGTGGGYAYYPAKTVPDNMQYTASFMARVITSGTVVQIGFDRQSISVKPVGAEWKKYSVTVMYSSDLLNLTITSSADSVWDIKDIQVEALPFATSYIPTNGAAATRAADVCMVNNVINTGKDTDSVNTTTGFTAAIVSDLKLTNGKNYPSIFGISPDSNPLNSQRRVTMGTGGFVELWCGGSIRAPANGLSTVVISKRVGESIGAVNGSIYKTPFLYGYSGSVIVFQTGHIRNFRIWHSALTDAQIKGLK